MRTTAIIINLVLLGLAGRLVFGGDFSLNSAEAPLFLAMLVAPIFSTVALLLRGSPNKDWLARYCERKALEERQKISQMQAQWSQPDGLTNRSEPMRLETKRTSEAAASGR